MRLSQINSTQNFNGNVVIIKNISKSERKEIKKVLPVLKDSVKDKNFDLFIKKTSFGETMVGTDKSCGYPVCHGDYLRSASLAIRDKLNPPCIERKMNEIKEVLLLGL